MRPVPFLSITLAVCLWALACTPVLQAQERAVEVRSAHQFYPATVAHSDTLLDQRTRPTIRGRIDRRTGVVRAQYRIEAETPVDGTAEAAARHFLESRSAEFGIVDQEDLLLERSTATRNSRHIAFQQVRDGIPVFGAAVKVNLDSGGRPTMVLSNYQPHLATAQIPAQRLAADAAVRLAAERAGGFITIVQEPELVIYPVESPLVAWHLVARPHDDSAEWSILIDAVDGEPILWMDQSAHSRRSRASYSREEGASAGSVPPLNTANGSGSVFDPDPLTTAGVDYGPPFVNADDADVPELNAQRKSVALRDITRGVDGHYRLEGPYVRIVSGNEIGAAYSPPAVASSDGFHFTRANDFFEAVNAYYHIDKSQRYVQELDSDLDIHRFPIRVNPHGMGAADNSQFRPASNVLLFGTGGIDDAEDAHVIWHEYAHALLEASSPGLLRTVEGQALHEGWSDYWAASYTRELIETGAVPVRDWRQVFTWDGNETWRGRRLEHSGTYPEDAPCSQAIACDIWQDGRLWATTLMEIYPHVGRRVLDHLNLLSHAYLASPVTMRDAAEAIIQADKDHYGGQHFSVLLDVFRRRGFVDSAAFAPFIVHSPPHTTEEVTGTLTFSAEVTSEATAIQAVRVVHLVDGAMIRHDLEHRGGATYEGDVPLPGTAGEVRYFIEVEDDVSHTIRYPGSAPAELFSVVVGPDEDPPVITHDPPQRVNVADWPARISATVVDRMDLEAVWVEYTAVMDGMVEAGEFELQLVTGGFEGAFPPLDVDPGTVIEYRIGARDASMARNEAVLPSDGTFTLEVTSGNLIRAYTFEGETDEGVTATGAWQRGAPLFGTRITRSGSSVWATSLDSSYPDRQSLSSLVLPRITLNNAEQAYLVFWHWYDIEHDGRAYPENPDVATLWDGGNVKFSSDGGVTWQVLHPVGGYPGRVSSAFENPLGGQDAFGGYSRGWRRDVFELPPFDEAMLRFDFGTDSGNFENAQQFAGWYIDDVEIRVGLDEDDQAPTFVDLPDSRVTSGAAHPPLRIQVGVQDDTGVEALQLHYRVFDESGSLVERDTIAFNMSATDARRFHVDFRPAHDLAPRYSAEYHLLARDFDGNETWSSAGGDGFRIDYLHHEQVSVLDELQHTGLWTWSNNRWVTAWRQDLIERSSLVIGPLDLPIQATTIELHLDHQYQLGDGVGGNVKVSSDDGRTWTLLAPDGGYDGIFSADDSHSMSDEEVFEGSANEQRISVFDLTHLEGRQVRLRLDYGNSRAAVQDDWWAVRNASLSIVATDDDLPIPRELRLHSNYPDPFSSTTTIGYTIPEEGIVLLEVYDVLGRRIDVIRYALQYPGTYTLTYDGSRLANGMYFLTLTIGDRREVQRMVVAR